MLISLLKQHPSLIRHGLDVDALSHCTAIIHRGHEAHGLWRAAAGGYEYVPAGFSEPSHRAPTLADVARVTEQLFDEGGHALAPANRAAVPA